MQQVVDLQNDAGFRKMGVALLSISPDSLHAWMAEGSRLGISTPLLSDPGNPVATTYCVMRWKMPSNEPGHTSVLVGTDGRIRWIRDYGAMEHGGAMYVPVPDLVAELARRL